MQRKVFLTVCLVAALAWAGCGKESGGSGKAGYAPAAGSTAMAEAAAPKAAPVTNDLGRLVPTDAVALFYVRNPKAFEGKLKAMLGRIEPEMAGEIDLAAMGAQMLPGASQYWDMGKPCAVAIALPADGSDPGAALTQGQGITFIFGMTDAAAAKTGMEAQLAEAPPEQRPLVRTSGSYLAFAPTPTTSWGSEPPALALDAPVGDVALRIDAAALVQRFRKQIDEGLDGMEEMMNQNAGAGAMPGQAESAMQMLGSIAGGMRDFVDAAELLEFGVAIEGSMMDLEMGFRVKAGSKLDLAATADTDLTALAGLLPEGFPLNLLMRMDTGKLMEWIMPFMEAVTKEMPEAERAKFKAYMDESMDMSKLIGPGFAVSLAVSDTGIQLVEVVDAKDGAAYMERAEKLFASDAMKGIPGIEMTWREPTKVAGVDVYGFDMRFDMAKMSGSGAGNLPPEAQEKMSALMKRVLGGEAMTMHMAAVENKIIATMGDLDHMKALIGVVSAGGGKPPAALAAAIEKAGGKPAFLLQMDLRALVGQVLGMVRDMADEPMPEVPAGGPIPVQLWGRHAGRQYGGGVSLDLGGLVDMVKAMMGD